MTPAQALQLLVEGIEAQAAKSAGGAFVKLDWIELELADARAVLDDERIQLDLAPTLVGPFAACASVRKVPVS